MTARYHFPKLAPDDLNEDQRELYRMLTGGRRAGEAASPTDAAGHLAGPFNAMLFAPAVGTAMQALGERIRFDLSLPDRERELATLYVAGRMGSPYEISAHRRLGAAAGLSAEEAATLAEGQVPDLPSDRERVILRLTAHLCDEQVNETVRSEAVAALGRRAVVELTLLVGYYRALALLLDTCGGNDNA
jgi:4-carboxymuconolactone decarboxylase